MVVSIDWNLCVGSGECVARAPRAFELVHFEDGLTVRAILRGVDDANVLREAAEACPTLAIHLRTGDGQVYPPT